jgi:hypothetical protein
VLNSEIEEARQEIVSDGYDMSVGELINLYRDQEIFINPSYQRLYRWKIEQKTKFVESLILGIPIPPIFVFQSEDGTWELIDGLQRVSTILQFVGILKNPTGSLMSPLILEGTKLLPSLEDKTWDGENPIGKDIQLLVKRARIRVEILRSQSHPQARYELFQRLNTGGVALTHQEVRSSVAIMLDDNFQDFLVECSNQQHFKNTTQLTENATNQQSDIELVLRFFAYRHIPYEKGDVNEYLDDALVELCNSHQFDRAQEMNVFLDTFAILDRILGENSFKRWTGERFQGQFSIAAFEVIATGLSHSLYRMRDMMDDATCTQEIEQKIKNLWVDSTFSRYSGAGVRGTSRLANLIPYARNYFEE